MRASNAPAFSLQGGGVLSGNLPPNYLASQRLAFIFLAYSLNRPESGSARLSTFPHWQALVRM